MACYKCDRDLLIPEVKVNHSVTGAPNRSIGKQDITGQSAELGPKNAVRLVAVLEHTLPPLQPTIESKNELRPKMAACGGLLQAKSQCDAWQHPRCRPFVWSR